MGNPHTDQEKSSGLFTLAVTLLVSVLAYVHGWLPQPLHDLIEYIVH